MRWRQSAWSWNVDDSATSTSGSSPGGARPRRGRPGGVVEHRADVADVGGQLGGEVEVGRGEHEDPAGAEDLVEEAAQRREAVGGPQLVEPGQALGPEPAGEAVDGAVAQPAERAGGGLEAEPEGRHARRREQVGVREQHVEGQAGRLGADHGADGEERAHDQVGSVVGDGGEHVGGVGGGRADELRVEQPVEQLHRVLALPVAVGVVLGPAAGPVGRLGPRAEGGAGGGDLVAHRVLGQHGDAVAALDEAADGAELGRHGAAAVDEGEEVGAGSGGHRCGSFQDADDEVGHGLLGLGAAQAAGRGAAASTL